MYISVVDLSTGEEEHHNTRIHSDHALLEYLCLKGAGNEVQGEKAGNVGAEGRAGNEGPGRDSGSCLKREMADESPCDWLSPSADTRALRDRLKGLDPPRMREAGNTQLPRQSQYGVVYFQQDRVSAPSCNGDPVRLPAYLPRLLAFSCKDAFGCCNPG